MPELFSEKKSLNAVNRFKRVPLTETQLEKTKYDVHHLKYLEEFKEIDSALDAEVKTYDPHIISRLHEPGQGPSTNRLAFPTPEGYLTFKSKQYHDFIKDLYNELYREGVIETRLLVNHALLFPLYPDFYPQPMFEIDRKHLADIDNIQAPMERLWRHCRDTVSLSDIKIKAKPLSSPGFPFQTHDGQNYNRSDVTYGTRSMFEDPLTVLRADYSQIKKDWIEYRVNDIFEKFLGMVGKDMTPDLATYAMTELLITNNRNGYRFNSIDKVLFDGLYHGESLYGKDRGYLTWGEDGYEAGKFNVKVFAGMVNNHFPSRLSPQRIRPINSSSYPTGIMHQIDAQAFLKPLEESKFGFLSERPDVVESYHNFLSTCEQRQTWFITMDRVNAELTITTNFEQFIKLVPESHRERFRLFMTHIKHTSKGAKMIRGLLSGVGWTTGFNVLVGLYEAFHTISVLTEISISEVADAYVTAFINDDDFVVLSPFKFKLFLPTDDIPLVINGPLKQERIDLVMKQAKDRMMDVEVNQTGFVTFGQKVTFFGTKPAAESQYSKLFYHEGPGQFTKDVFSMSARFQLVEHTDLIEHVMMKHLHVGRNWYDRQSVLFLRELSSLGIGLGDVLNEYAPAEQLILERFAGLDPIESTQMVDSVHYEQIFKELILT